MLSWKRKSSSFGVVLIILAAHCSNISAVPYTQGHEEHDVTLASLRLQDGNTTASPVAPADNNVTKAPTAAPAPNGNNTTTAPVAAPIAPPPPPAPVTAAPVVPPPPTTKAPVQTTAPVPAPPLPTSTPTVPYTTSPTISPTSNSTDDDNNDPTKKHKSSSFRRKLFKFTFYTLLFSAIGAALYQLRLASNRQRVYAILQQIWYRLQRVEWRRRTSEVVFKIGQFLYRIPGVPRLVTAVSTRWYSFRYGRNGGRGGSAGGDGTGGGGAVSLNTVMGRDMQESDMQESLLLREETDV